MFTIPNRIIMVHIFLIRTIFNGPITKCNWTRDYDEFVIDQSIHIYQLALFDLQKDK